MDTVYFEGRTVAFRIATLPRKGGLEVGPWLFGERISNPTPLESRKRNLYLIAPGRQHHISGFEDYDHTEIINEIPTGGGAVEWDVYWGVVLDPSLKQEFSSENQLIVATQRQFRPSAGFQFRDIPGAGFLRRVLKIESLKQVQKYRRPGGNLPQVLILPAGFAVRASAEELSESERSGSSPNRTSR